MNTPNPNPFLELILQWNFYEFNLMQTIGPKQMKNTLIFVVLVMSYETQLS